eukprot:3604-Eustigmatos_ZCMA.PRE.1
MAKSGADIVSLDWTVTMEEGRRRIGEDMGVQGNLDPAVLYAPHDVIKVHTLPCIHSKALSYAGPSSCVKTIGSLGCMSRLVE